ncbi:MAG: DUF262 domain-containing protein [Dethiosulfatibacter sp.]|nr:DUF262 domain-containing protein [Dethiosulfatibacter sp.]
MGATLQSFISIFNTNHEVDGEIVQLKNITIPLIQRDYAQGRQDSEVQRVRKRFLDSLHRAIVEKPITLDFIYGDVDGNGVMTPLDGQQRLTTLFLLHWYAAKREGIVTNEYSFLKKFSYETRYSARDFCGYLVDFTPSFEQKPSEEIINQSWFPLDWKKDPTISAMLVMSDAISEVFGGVQNIWERLNDNAISFYFLPVKDMGLTDELYIKMNSRGKPLTPFEHFKAEFEHNLKIIDKDVAKRIIKKIDLDWTDMLWRYRGDDNIIDDEFLRYYKFVCDVICYENGDSPQGKSSDEFDLMKQYFSKSNENAMKNIETFEKYFDCWCNLDEVESPESFFVSFLSHVHENDKIRIENRYAIDIMEDCLRNYGIFSGKNRQFPLNRIVLLYAMICYLLNRDKIDKHDFTRRIRIINNLIQNSEDEISDSELRSSGNRMPAILKQVDYIIMSGVIDDSIDKNFNINQLAEEKEKQKWLIYNQDKETLLFELEDHFLLEGQIGIVGLENFDYFQRFKSLFECDWDLIDCALMSIGNYSQREQNNWRYQLGSKRNLNAWRNLFHKSSNAGFSDTKRILADLLSRADVFTNDVLEKVIHDFISDCEKNNIFEWRYYYVKYDIFRPGSYGKYYWRDFTSNPYVMSVMKTNSQISQNSYNPFLKVADEKNLSKEDWGERIIFKDNYIVCTNSAFEIRKQITDEEISRIVINQNASGIDVEDRIIKLKKYLQSFA